MYHKRTLFLHSLSDFVEETFQSELFDWWSSMIPQSSVMTNIIV